jgi:HEAT repeat protein
MLRFHTVVLACLLLTGGTLALAQTDAAAGKADSEQLKIAALEALMSAPPEKALPIVRKVLDGAGSDELKARALFILSQIELPEAQALLVEWARTASDPLRLEAIRMIGIGGDAQALAGLSDLYGSGDRRTRKAVLEAWLIADDKEAVYRVAAGAQNAAEFDAAVETLGAMDATEELRALRDRADMSESLIQAYAVAGDVKTLQEIATDGSNPERQLQAIRGLGIAGENGVAEILVGIYSGTDSRPVKDAALQGLLIADEDEAVLQLFRNSQDEDEKLRLLETLVIMDSKAVWDIIDATLENGR